jgi:hypothetical protein
MLKRAAIAALVTAAATGPAPEGTPPADPVVSSGPMWLAVPLLMALLVAVVFLRRGALAPPTWWRPIAGVIIVLGGVLAALSVLMIGLMSSWTDSGSNIPAPFLIGAVVVLGIAVLVALRVFRSGRPASMVGP